MAPECREQPAVSVNSAMKIVSKTWLVFIDRAGIQSREGGLNLERWSSGWERDMFKVRSSVPEFPIKFRDDCYVKIRKSGIDQG